MAHKISPEVETILRSGVCDSATFTLVTQLDRKMYDAVNKVLDLSGFKWDRKVKKHLATNGNAAETLAKALGDGKIVDPKKEFDFFQTPEDLALRMAEMLRVEPHHTILEPSAGGGRLCRAIVEFNHEIKKHQIYYFEIQENLNLDLHRAGFSPIGYDFDEMAWSFPNHFDRILANPPFSNAQDILHFRKMYDCLKPSGRMVCITGTSWQWRTQKKFTEFKKWIWSLPPLSQIEELPSGTFKDSGTNVPALLITLDKEE